MTAMPANLLICNKHRLMLGGHRCLQVELSRTGVIQPTTSQVKAMTHPEWSFFSCQLPTKVIGKVVAVPLQKMVCIALILLSHLLHSLLYMLGCHGSIPN